MPESTQFEPVLREWVHIFMRRSMQAFTHWMSENDLSRSQIGALMRLHYQGRCPVSGIGTDLGITTPAASQLVDRLVQMGLLARTADPSDRRVKMVTLSEDGQELIREGMQARMGWMEDIAAALSEADKTEITKALQKLVEAAHNNMEEIELVN